MKVKLLDREHNNVGGEVITEADLLAKLLAMRQLEPFIADILAENGQKLTPIKPARSIGKSFFFRKFFFSV